MYNLTKDLIAYKGTNPKPKNFDIFWKNALNSIENHDAHVKLVKADTQYENVECYDLFFKGIDGSTIYAKYLKPTINKKPKAVLQFHGYMYHSGSWSEKLAFTSQGYSVVAMDCRGQGGFSEDLTAFKGTTIYGHVIKGLLEGANNLYYKYTFLDTAILSRAIMQLEDISGLYAMGESQGGGLAIACAGLVPEVEKIAVQNPFLSDYQKAWELGAGREQTRIVDYFRLFDPLHKKQDEFFETLDYIDVHNFADKIKGKVLFGTGVLDNICPIATQMAVYNNIQTEKTLRLYPDFAHENMPGFWDETLAFFNN